MFFILGGKMLTKEEIKNKLQEDPDWTLPDDATDEEWDLYFEVKDSLGGEEMVEGEDDSWEEDTDEVI